MPQEVILEVCVDTAADARIAQQHGAHRIELCSRLDADGLTPSHDLAEEVLAAASIPVFAMIRPDNTMVLADDQLTTIESDLRRLKRLPFAGFVFGAVHQNGDLNGLACARMIELAGERPVTLHRAFDHTRDRARALETAINLGFSRILTAGGATTAWDGRRELRQLIEAADGRITVIAGGGVRAQNVAALVAATGASEVHSSARVAASQSTSAAQVESILEQLRGSVSTDD